MNAFDYQNGRLKYRTLNDFGVDIILKTDIVIINGNSATGKTLLVNSIREQKDNEDANGISEYSFGNIETIRKKDELGRLNFSKKGNLYIIDRADIILKDRSIVDNIYFDTSNKYIIMARCNLGFNLSPNYYAEMLCDNNVLSIRYYFDYEGWR